MSVLSRVGMPVFSAGGMPQISDGDYRLQVSGLVAQEQGFDLTQVRAWPQSSLDARLSSVSGFSVRSVWQGTLWGDFLSVASPDPAASHVTFISYGGGYRTNLALADIPAKRAILCHQVADEPLEREYGGPLRMVIPNLWGYKSAKWLAKVEFGDRAQGGYWEDRGYSRHGRIEPGTTLDLNSGQRRAHGAGEITEF